jgi:hypothetical protein
MKKKKKKKVAKSGRRSSTAQWLKPPTIKLATNRTTPKGHGGG